MQKLCHDKLEWDDSLPNNLLHEWKELQIWVKIVQSLLQEVTFMVLMETPPRWLYAAFVMGTYKRMQP